MTIGIEAILSNKIIILLLIILLKLNDIAGSDVIGGAILGALIAISFAYWIGRDYFSKDKLETDFDENV